MKAVVFGTLALALAACSGGPVKNGSNLPNGSVVRPNPPKESVFLRASFDDDPSTFIGRFVPDNLTPAEIDETTAAQTRCSEFLAYKEMRSSGTYDETFNASQSVSGSIGIEAIAGVSASSDQGAGVRVKYKLTKKMVATKKSAADYDRCCKAQPDQCSRRYIGEFLAGTGSVFQYAGAENSVKASGAYKLVSGDFDFKKGFGWKRVTEFEDIYFAFRTHAGSLGGGDTGGDDTECKWANNVPSSLDGYYFVGMSQPVPSKAQSRDYALQNAGTQVVKYLGDYITSQMGSVSNAMQGYLDDQQVVTSVAQGLAKRVKAEKWCQAEQIPTPEGVKFVGKVLVFFPKAEEEAAAKDTVGAIEESLQSQGKLSDGDKKALADIRAKLGK